MKASLNWLKDWVDLEDQSAEKIAAILTDCGLEVESVHRQDAGLEKVISVQIISKIKHPEADRLSVCTVNLGGAEKKEYLEIVCGAQNMKVGDVVFLAQVGSVLPNGQKIEKGKIRGVVSNGMLCSEAELGLPNTVDGLLILPEKTPVGWTASDVLVLNDVIFEIKLTANRGDCLSHRGLARELAAALGRPLKTPKIAKLDFAAATTGARPMKIELHAGTDAPQFYGCSIDGIVIQDSPGWLKTRLESIGQRSINNIVDVSNFLMFEYGFPVHIYDADKLEGGVIKVERSQKNAKMKLLDGSEIETTGEELVIADGAKVVGLAGVMGGGNSEVTAQTRRVFLECAEFNPTLVRRAAFKHQKRSEASLRFEKGIDPEGLPEAIARLANLVERVSSGVINGATSARVSSAPVVQKTISVSPKFINEFLGTEISEVKMLEILKSLDCKVENWKITPPSYRLDLNIPADFAEEIARCVGYDQIPATIPVLTGMPAPEHSNALAHRLQTIDAIKNAFKAQGMSEVLNYAFQSEAWVEKFKMKSTVKILNPLSEEQGFMVPSLLPGMMKTYLENERHHFGSEPLAVRIFEVRPTFHSPTNDISAKSETDTGVTETWRISALISGPRYEQAIKSERGEVDFYDLKNIVESVFEKLGTKGLRYRAGAPENSELFHPGQCVQVAVGKEAIGFFGRVHPKLEADLKVRNPLFWLEFTLDPVISLTPMQKTQFKAWPNFPTMERDFALLVKDSVSAENLMNIAIKMGKPIAKVVKIFDTYKGAHIPDGMISIGVRVIFSDENKSLEEKQVDQTAEAIVKQWAEETGATLR